MTTKVIRPKSAKPAIAPVTAISARTILILGAARATAIANKPIRTKWSSRPSNAAATPP